jgi:hypothetical protein
LTLLHNHSEYGRIYSLFICGPLDALDLRCTEMLFFAGTGRGRFIPFHDRKPSPEIGDHEGELLSVANTIDIDVGGPLLARPYNPFSDTADLVRLERAVVITIQKK